MPLPNEPINSEESSSDSESTKGDSVSLELIVQTLIRNAIKYPSSAEYVLKSFRDLDRPGDVVPIVISYVEQNYAIKPKARLEVYGLLAELLPLEIDVALEAVSASSLKSFVLRAIADVDIVSESHPAFVSTGMVDSIANLLAVLSSHAFEEVVLTVLLTKEFVNGKPTVRNQLVVDAIEKCFAHTYRGECLSQVFAHLCQDNLWAHFGLIVSLAVGLHRLHSGLEDSLLLVDKLLSFVFSEPESSFASEQLEACVYLQSLHRNEQVKIEDAVVLVGIRGLESEDSRDRFWGLLEIAWTFQLMTQCKDLLSIALELTNSGKYLKVWSLNSGATSFLVSEAAANPAAFVALTQIAATQGAKLEPTVVDLVHQQCVNSGSSPHQLIALISAIDLSLVSLTMTQFLIQQANTKLVESALFRICSAKEISFRAEILASLIAAIRTHKSVGTLCVCVTALLSEQDPELLTLLPDGMDVLAWLLTRLEQTEARGEAEAISGALTHLSGLVHPSWVHVWDPARLVAIADGSDTVQSTFRYLLEHLDCHSEEERLEIILAVGDRNGLVFWGEAMREIARDYSVSLFNEQLAFMNNQWTKHDPAVLAQCIGQLAEFRFEIVQDFLFEKLNSDISSSLQNILRISKSSFRFLFPTSEAAIAETLATRAGAFRGFGVLFKVCRRLSEPKIEHVLVELLLAALSHELEQFKVCVKEKVAVDSTSVLTTVATIACVGDLAAAATTNGFSRFQTEAISVILSFLSEASWSLDQGGSFLLESLLVTLGRLVAIPHLSISQEAFGSVLETTLQCLVESVPVDFKVVANDAMQVRCVLSAKVIQALFGHAESWHGLGKLILAVHSLGGAGPLPLVRWVCVRLMSALIDEAPEVRDEQEALEWVQIVAIVYPRTWDSYLQVKQEAECVVDKLFLRSKHRNSVLNLPTRLLGPFLHNLLPAIDDPDVDMSVANLTVEILAASSDALFCSEPESAKKLCQFIFLSENPARTVIAGALKYIAYVQFEVVLGCVLEGTQIGKLEVRVIHSLARSKATLAKLVQSLLTTRQHNAGIALGHLMDCFDDSGVANIALKYFGALYAFLLLIEPPVEWAIPKLIHASGLPRVNSLEELSVTQQLGAAEYIYPLLSSCTKATQLSTELVGKSKKIDDMFVETFLAANELCTLKGLIKIVKNNSHTTDSLFPRIAECASRSLLSMDDEITLGALNLLRSLMDEKKHINWLPVLALLRRTVDRDSQPVRAASFVLIGAICDKGSESEEFFRLASDLWIPAVVRSFVCEAAKGAFMSILRNAMSDNQNNGEGSVLELVKANAGECSSLQLDACCYYLLGLPGTCDSVALAAAQLVPVIVSLIPSPSGATTQSLIAILEQLIRDPKLTLSSASILVEAKRLDCLEFQ